MKKNISKEKFLKKYKHGNYNLIKINKEEVIKFDKNHQINKPNYLLEGKKWTLIDNKYYEIPKPLTLTWLRNLNVFIKAGVCLLLVCAVATPFIVPIFLSSNTEINETEWSSSFNYLIESNESRKFTMSCSSVLSTPGQADINSNIDLEVDGYNEKENDKIQSEINYFTYDKTKDVLYQCKKDEQEAKWQVALSSESLPSKNYFFTFGGDTGYAKNFNKFSYNSNKFSVTNMDVKTKLEGEEVTLKSNCEIVFNKDKKLEKVNEVLFGDIVKPQSNETIHLQISNNYTFSNFEKTLIVLPGDDPKKYDGKVEEDEWSYAFNKIYNATMTNLNLTYSSSGSGPYGGEGNYRINKDAVVSVEDDATTYEKYKCGCWFTLDDNKLISKVNDSNECKPKYILNRLYSALYEKYSEATYYTTSEKEYSYLNKTYEYDVQLNEKLFTEFNVEKNINRIYSLVEHTETCSSFYDYGMTFIDEAEIPSEISNLPQLEKNSLELHEYDSKALQLSTDSNYFFTLELQEGSTCNLSNCKLVTYNSNESDENECSCIESVEIYANGSKMTTGYSLANKNTITFDNAMQGDTQLVFNIKTIATEIPNKVMAKFTFDIT